MGIEFTDREIMFQMLSRAGVIPSMGKDYIELDNEITLWFHEDGSLHWINNDRFCDRAY